MINRSSSLLLSVLAVAALAGPASAQDAPSDAPSDAVEDIVVTARRIEGPMWEVRRGDSVEWINKDPFPHTVTCAGVFDSQSIAEGARWTYRADRRGRFAYTCTFHPNMNGTLVVT